MYIVLTDGRSQSRQHIFNDNDGKLAKFLEYLGDNYCLDNSAEWEIVKSLEDLVVDLDEE